MPKTKETILICLLTFLVTVGLSLTAQKALRALVIGTDVTLSGNLNMNNHSIEGVAVSSDPNSAATKDYVDAAIGGGGGGGGSGFAFFDTVGEHTWSRPEGVMFINIMLVGGGGGGGARAPDGESKWGENGETSYFEGGYYVGSNKIEAYGGKGDGSGGNLASFAYDSEFDNFKDFISFNVLVENFSSALASILGQNNFPDGGSPGSSGVSGGDGNAGEDIVSSNRPFCSGGDGGTGRDWGESDALGGGGGAGGVRPFHMLCDDTPRAGNGGAGGRLTSADGDTDCEGGGGGYGGRGYGAGGGSGGSGNSIWGGTCNVLPGYNGGGAGSVVIINQLPLFYKADTYTVYVGNGGKGANGRDGYRGCEGNIAQGGSAGQDGENGCSCINYDCVGGGGGYGAGGGGTRGFVLIWWGDLGRRPKLPYE